MNFIAEHWQEGMVILVLVAMVVGFKGSNPNKGNKKDSNSSSGGGQNDSSPSNN